MLPGGFGCAPGSPTARPQLKDHNFVVADESTCSIAERLAGFSIVGAVLGMFCSGESLTCCDHFARLHPLHS